MKAACYVMTRNVYEWTVPSVKALLSFSDVDRIYLLTEDDEIGYSVPECVEIRNVSNQEYFTRDGPNWASPWSWMVLMRVAYPLVFPDLDRILSIDQDAVCCGDVCELWEQPVRDMYYAGVTEKQLSSPGKPYFNAGVMLHNLEKLRKDGMPERMIRELNKNQHRFPEQDVINRMCAGKIYNLPSEYNANRYCGTERGVRIRHYAAEGNWYRYPEVQKWLDVPWETCLKRNQEWKIMTERKAFR